MNPSPTVEENGFRVTNVFVADAQGHSLIPNRKPCNLVILTLERLNLWIDQQNVDPRVATIVKQLAEKYPHNALWSFKRNFQSYVSRAQKEIKIRDQKQELAEPIKEL